MMKKMFALVMFFQSMLYPNIEYNHPEFNWKTIETEHFKVHFHDETEMSAREAATVAETIYLPITEFYDFRPSNKTHLILIDPDDYSNGAAYYYDNKIKIWAMPLDFELRGSHRWLQNVITHEFAHIVSLQKAMKAGTGIPGAYFQIMSYEEEKRSDVLYGYPNTLISYPIPGTCVPPWLAEGVAQYMYENANWDNWDSHRDMILRDRVVYNKVLTFNEINTFGKKGIGNESTYNAGFAFSTYIVNQYGPESLKNIMDQLSSPLQYSVNDAMFDILGEHGDEIYSNFKDKLEIRYKRLVEPIRLLPINGKILRDKGTTNIHPKWHPDGNSFVYLSNKQNDYFGQTNLYHYNLETGEEKKIKSGVFSAPTWHSNKNIVYYTKKPKFPNKNGSKFYDIYSYDFETEAEERLTTDARAFYPVFIEKDSLVAYIATFDGGQNLYTLDLRNKRSIKITDFRSRPMISHLSYDSLSHSLYFDITRHHFRDIYKYDFNEGSVKEVKNDPLYDERNMTTSNQERQIYANDKSGIYNLYMIDNKNEVEGYISNVTGGAFMPNISKDGKILFSLYQNGCYKISLLENPVTISSDFVGYDDGYYLNNKDFDKPIVELDMTKEKKYEDQFPNMFIMPKIMVDYNTLKTGFYFQSSEIIDRLSLFGEASANKFRDVDYMFRLDFRRFFNTVFFETYYLTRNTTDNSFYQDTYEITDNIKFRLVQFRLGIKQPFYGSMFEHSISKQYYRAFIKEQVQTNEYGRLEAGAAYDYYKGTIFNTNWSLNMIKKSAHSSINPSGGFKIGTELGIELNKFIEGLNLSDSGTLTEEFKDYNLIRALGFGSYYYGIPKFKNWTIALKAEVGWIDNQDVDSFFHFYLGGMPGIKGYSFYSIQGPKKVFIDFTLRAPIFMEKHYKLSWMTIQNSTIGIVFQNGDAWDTRYMNKQSVGIQWRINGFSFYNFPTAIELEYHKPTVTFETEINNTSIKYGQNGKTYIKVLFDF